MIIICCFFFYHYVKGELNWLGSVGSERHHWYILKGMKLNWRSGTASLRSTRTGRIVLAVNDRKGKNSGRLILFAMNDWAAENTKFADSVHGKSWRVDGTVPNRFGPLGCSCYACTITESFRMQSSAIVYSVE